MNILTNVNIRTRRSIEGGYEGVVTSPHGVLHVSPNFSDRASARKEAREWRAALAKAYILASTSLVESVGRADKDARILAVHPDGKTYIYICDGVCQRVSPGQARALYRHMPVHGQIYEHETRDEQDM